MKVTLGSLLKALALVVALAASLVHSSYAQVDVASGKTLYEAAAPAPWGAGTSSCQSCHFSGVAPSMTQGLGAGSQHPLAANNSALINAAFTAGGVMAAYMAGTGRPVHTVTPAQAYQLSLYIGQFKAPQPSNSTLATRTGVSRTINVYSLLPTDGSSGVAADGGVSAAVSVNGVTPSINVTTVQPVAYNITYTPPANFVGGDSFTYRLVNPAAPAPASNTIAVSVFGINSVGTATAFRAQNYAQGSFGLYRITTNDLGGSPGSNFTASGLPAGLQVDSATGEIYGNATGVAGSYSVTLGARVNSAGANNGNVSKTLTLTLVGITSANAVNYSQNTAIAPYTITAFPAAVAPFSISTGALPNGLSLVGNQITGTPLVAGSFPVTVQANTAAGTVSQGLAITVGPIPVIASTPAAGVAPAITLIGVTGTAIANIQINATTPPAVSGGSYIATGIAASGLVVDANTGVISGIPTASGDFPVVLGASNTNGQGTLNVIFRVNSSLAPVLTSPAAATPVAVGVNGAVYQITASNGPITGYGIVAANLLPPGLALNPGTGAVSGTPTTSGIFVTNLSATNTTPLTGSKAITFTINPIVAPTITSPTFASLAVGVPIAPIQIVATNPPILSYGLLGGTALPAGLTLNTVTGLITGTPTTPGPVTTTLTATNVFNTGSLAVPFTVGVPAPSACAMTVPLNTATTLDLKPCMFPAFTPSGVSVLATPAHGTVAVNGTSVSYTPVNNYFGTDSFSAVAYFAGGGTTVAGLVTVTVIGRPDPTQDPTVVALLGAQADTAQRFSRAQISNFQRRMESLHQGGDTAGAAAPSLQAKGDAASRPLAGGLEAVLNQPTPNTPSTVPSVISPVFVGPATPIALTQAQGVDAVATGLGLKSLPFAETVTSLLTTNAMNLANLVASNPLAQPGDTSFWVEGVASFGKRDANGAATGLEFSSNGITVGFDKRVNDQWAYGFGLGFGRDKTIIGTDGSQNDGRGLSLAAYASYQPTPTTFIDGLIGVGTLDFDTRRYVAPVNDFALGNRKGTQFFGSLTAGYEHRQNGVLWSPYGRVDFSSDQLQDSTEVGAGAYALTYFGQTSQSLQGTLGARAESIHATSFGWAIPRIRAEYRHEFQGDRQAFISYADQVGGPRYGLAVAGAGRDALVLGLGTDFIMRDGWTLGIDYQLSQTSAQDSSYALRLKLTKDFDVRGLPKLVGSYVDNPTKPLDVQVDAGYVIDDNVTRAKAGPDVMSDTAYIVNVSKSEVFNISEQSRAIITGTVGGERFQNFNGLSRVSETLEAELQYRDSSEFDAPTFALFGRLTAEQYQSQLRSGYRFALGVSMRQPLTDRISLFSAVTHAERRGNSAVFNTVDDSLKLNVDYTLSDRATLYATGEYRKGDIVSTGRASLENVSIAKVFTQDDAYAGGQFFSYRFDGSSVLTTLGYNIGFGPRDSLDFSWRRVESTPSLRPSFVTSPSSYITNQWSITYLVRF